jgi:Ser-tRNA(Ala) deacylase AlaX
VTLSESSTKSRKGRFKTRGTGATKRNWRLKVQFFVLVIVAHTENTLNTTTTMEFADKKEEDEVKKVCERLYLNDSHLFDCSASLVSLTLQPEDAKYGRYKILLDQTVFHPQGGGQPTDSGIITFPDGVTFDVVFVQNNAEGDIEHLGDFTQGKEAAEDHHFPAAGTSAQLAVDKEKRIEHIRLHSAGHVMDAALKRLGFWDRIKSGKGYHFPDNPYVEYVGQLTPEEMETLPATLTAEVQRIVEEDIPTSLFMEEKVAAGELCSIDTSAYPPVVRVADIAGSPCPCGGTHIKSSRELGGLQVTRCKKKKKMIRISYVLVD